MQIFFKDSFIPWFLGEFDSSKKVGQYADYISIILKVKQALAGVAQCM